MNYTEQQIEQAMQAFSCTREEAIESKVEEMLAAQTAWRAEQDNIAYRFKRATEYPSIGDQLDALWKGGEALDEMSAKIQAVKEKYPKPNQE
jgi:hypothetical protein